MRREHAPQPADPAADLHHRHDQLLAVPPRLQQIVVQLVDLPNDVVDRCAIALDLPAEKYSEEGRRIERPSFARPLERLGELGDELHVRLVRRRDPALPDDADHVAWYEVVVGVEADHLDAHQILTILDTRGGRRLEQGPERRSVVVQRSEHVGQLRDAPIGDRRIEPDERVLALFQA